MENNPSLSNFGTSVMPQCLSTRSGRRPLGSSSSNLLPKESWGHAKRLIRITKVIWKNEQSPITNCIGDPAVHPKFVTGEVGDTAIVLSILGIAKKDDTFDLVTDS